MLNQVSQIRSSGQAKQASESLLTVASSTLADSLELLQALGRDDLERAFGLSQLGRLQRIPANVPWNIDRNIARGEESGPSSLGLVDSENRAYVKSSVLPPHLHLLNEFVEPHGKGHLQRRWRRSRSLRAVDESSSSFDAADIFAPSHAAGWRICRSFPARFRQSPVCPRLPGSSFGFLR